MKPEVNIEQVERTILHPSGLTYNQSGITFNGSSIYFNSSVARSVDAKPVAAGGRAEVIAAGIEIIDQNTLNSPSVIMESTTVTMESATAYMNDTERRSVDAKPVVTT